MTSKTTREMYVAGDRVGMLTVIRYAGKNNNKNPSNTWLCICDCGAEKVVPESSMRRGLVKSCGCLQREKARMRMAKELRQPIDSPCGGKLIPLTRGKFALIDSDDCDRVAETNWHFHHSGYALRHRNNEKKQYMHRFIMGEPVGFLVDHINGNKLDNRKSNLRICTVHQNQMNQHVRARGTSHYKGVRLRQSGRWAAYIKAWNKTYWLGTYDTEIEAAMAYNEKARELHGEFANINAIQQEIERMNNDSKD